MESLNDIEKYQLLEESGIDLKHPAIRSEVETISNMKKLKSALTDPEKRQKFFVEKWNYEDVADFVEKDVNRAINLHE